MWHFYTPWKPKVFWRFQGVYKCDTGLKWVNLFLEKSQKFLHQNYFDVMFSCMIRRDLFITLIKQLVFTGEELLAGATVTLFCFRLLSRNRLRLSLIFFVENSIPKLKFMVSITYSQIYFTKGGIHSHTRYRMEPVSGLVFSSANLNPRTKC